MGKGKRLYELYLGLGVTAYVLFENSYYSVYQDTPYGHIDSITFETFGEAVEYINNLT